MEIPFVPPALENELDRIARKQNPRVQNWWGYSGSSANVRRYRCYLCRDIMDTDSGKWRPTKHAERSVAEHALSHLSELNKRVQVRSARQVLRVEGFAACADFLAWLNPAASAAFLRGLPAAKQIELVAELLRQELALPCSIHELDPATQVEIDQHLEKTMT